MGSLAQPLVALVWHCTQLILVTIQVEVRARANPDPRFTFVVLRSSFTLCVSDWPELRAVLLPQPSQVLRSCLLTCWVRLTFIFSPL